MPGRALFGEQQQGVHAGRRGHAVRLQCLDAVEAASILGRLLGGAWLRRAVAGQFRAARERPRVRPLHPCEPDREDVNERTIRPLDAEGALKYLQAGLVEWRQHHA
jgi:hypothetical protein